MRGFSTYLDKLPEPFKSVICSISTLLAGEILLTPQSQKKIEVLLQM